MNSYSVFVLILCVTVSDGKDNAQPSDTLYGQNNTKYSQLATGKHTYHYHYVYQNIIGNTDIFDLRTEVISPKHKSIDDGILRYNVGDKLKLLCSEKTKNKRIYMQWNIVNNLNKESLTWRNNTHISYDLYLEMELKSFDNGTLVYCSVVNASGKTLQASNNITLELIGQTDATEVITAIYSKSAEVLNTHYCGQGQKVIICTKNDMRIYCETYLEDYNDTAKFVRYISNEIAHYVNENGVSLANLNIILGVSVTISSIIVAIIALLLYRRRQHRNVEGSVPNSSPEPVYEEIPEDVPPSMRLDARRGLHHVHGIRLNHETGVLTVHEHCFRRVSIKRENEL